MLACMNSSAFGWTLPHQSNFGHSALLRSSFYGCYTKSKASGHTTTSALIISWFPSFSKSSSAACLRVRSALSPSSSLPQQILFSNTEQDKTSQLCRLRRNRATSLQEQFVWRSIRSLLPKGILLSSLSVVWKNSCLQAVEYDLLPLEQQTSPLRHRLRPTILPIQALWNTSLAHFYSGLAAYPHSAIPLRSLNPTASVEKGTLHQRSDSGHF